MFLLFAQGLLAQTLQNISITNKKLTGFYTVEGPITFASFDLFPCHIVRVVDGKIIIYQTGDVHPLVKILHMRIKGIDLSKTEKQATALIKSILLKSSRIVRHQLCSNDFVGGRTVARLVSE